MTSMLIRWLLLVLAWITGLGRSSRSIGAAAILLALLVGGHTAPSQECPTPQRLSLELGYQSGLPPSRRALAVPASNRPSPASAPSHRISSDLASSSHAGQIASTSVVRYRGELYDAHTDTVFLRNRTYSPSLGRFTTMDPKGMVDGPNMYNYCGGDPVNRADPMGTKWFWENGQWVWHTTTEDPGATNLPLYILQEWFGQYLPPKPGAPPAPSGGGVTGIGTGGFGTGSLSFQGVAADLDPNEVISEAHRQNVVLLKIEATGIAMVVSPAGALTAGAFGAADAYLHDQDVAGGVFSSGPYGALAPLAKYQAARTLMLTTGYVLGMKGALQDVEDGNLLGALFRAGTAGSLLPGGLRNTRAFFGENPRLNPLNYRIDFQSGTGTSPAMGVPIPRRITYVNPKQEAIQGAIEADGLTVLEGRGQPRFGPGRPGGSPVRDQIEKIAKLFTDRGWRVIGGAQDVPKEVRLPGYDGGKLGSVYVDLVVQNPATGQRIYINTIDRPGSWRYLNEEMPAIDRAKALHGIDILPVLKTRSE